MHLGSTTLDAAFLGSLASIIVIDLLLAGDNAVVIAMAVRHLPPHQRRRGILFGAGAAVVVRVVITFFVAQLLSMPFVKLAGGLVILWIAMKLFAGGDEEDLAGHEARGIWEAVKLIVVADITMSLDNMLAVGGASNGSVLLLGIGLAVSIPFVVFTSDLLSRLMDRWPVVVYVGAAILGKVAAEMILTDPLTVSHFHPSRTAIYLAEAGFAVATVVAGRYFERRAAAAAETVPPG